jgi:hypothetical protein
MEVKNGKALSLRRRYSEMQYSADTAVMKRAVVRTPNSIAIRMTTNPMM